MARSIGPVSSNDAVNDERLVWDRTLAEGLLRRLLWLHYELHMPAAHMQIPQLLVGGVAILWVASEIVFGLRRRARAVKRQDRASALLLRLTLYVSCTAVVVLIKVPGTQSVLHFGFLEPWVGYLGCGVALIGIVIRWMAVVTLGKQFTVRVSILQDHTLVESGIYSVIRHPSYLGILICLAGLGLALQNWIVVATLVIPALLSLLYRMDVEERALEAHFGGEYEKYRRRTKRLIPGVY